MSDTSIILHAGCILIGQGSPMRAYTLDEAEAHARLILEMVEQGRLRAQPETVSERAS